MTFNIVAMIFIITACLSGFVIARNHYGHTHIGGGTYQGPRGGYYEYNAYGERRYF
jgi:hypothetical protein